MIVDRNSYSAVALSAQPLPGATAYGAGKVSALLSSVLLSHLPVRPSLKGSPALLKLEVPMDYLSHILPSDLVTALTPSL
jgi:hypothetical protein